MKTQPAPKPPIIFQIGSMLNSTRDTIMASLKVLGKDNQKPKELQ